MSPDGGTDQALCSIVGDPLVQVLPSTTVHLRMTIDTRRRSECVRARRMAGVFCGTFHLRFSCTVATPRCWMLGVAVHCAEAPPPCSSCATQLTAEQRTR